MALLTEQDLVDQAGGQDRFDKLLVDAAGSPARAAKIAGMLANGEAVIITKVGRRFDVSEVANPDQVTPLVMLAAQYAVLQYRLMREGGTDNNLDAALTRALTELEKVASGLNWVGDAYPEQGQRTSIGFVRTAGGNQSLDSVRRLWA